MTAPPHDDDALAKVVTRMRRRVRAIRAARGAIEMAIFGASFALFVLLGAKTGRLPEEPARRLLWAALAFPLLGALFGAARRVSALNAAQFLDRAYALSGRLANALAFRALPRAERTPMMEAAIADANEQARTRDLRPSRVLAWRWPPEAAYAAAMLLILGAVAGVEFRRPVEPLRRPLPLASSRDPLLLAEDDIEAFREFVRQMEERAHTEESRRAIERFDRFIDRIASEQLDRQQAFRELQLLQSELEANVQNDRDALRDALRELGNRMDSSDAARRLAQALQQPDPRAAAEAMRQLAQQIRENRLDARARQDLQRALSRATQQDRTDLSERLRRAREEIERLLRQQRERQLTESEQRQLRQRQRELEQLNRENQRRESQRRQLERLERALSRAAQDLLRDLAQAAQDLEEGAQDLNRMHEQDLSEQELAELRQQLEDLRQRMRQQNGQGGQERRRMIQRFAGRARGGLQPGGMQSSGRMRLTLTRGGRGGMQVPGGQGRQGQMPGQQGASQDGSGAGNEHDERIRGAATHLDARMRTVQVAGQQTGNGPSRAQVIRTAAQQGFTGQDYREVHAQYWDHAREVVHAGEVPPGYRSYVRRYFQLIRPRE